ncbi:MAG: gluconate 2-dehydrogenase subunit 3 family protein [Rhodothermales bacterium]|nr:gluconate 2-dehydrogenase subunit 3 family protein [Rhodothermales bacterium]
MSDLIHRREALRRIAVFVGGTVSAPVLSGVLGGCSAPSGDEAATYAYQTLDENQQRQIAALVDRIIPATDTPGAAEAGVPQFIDKMLAEWYAPEERDVFLLGLAEVDERAQAEAGGAFTDLDAEAQAAFVAALDAETYPSLGPEDSELAATDDDVVESGQEGTYKAEEEAEREVAGMQGDLGAAQTDSSSATQINTGEGTAAVGGQGAPPPFFRQVKELTLAGYYTSEVGATEELRWNPAPGRYDPDVPLSEIGRAWA